MSIGEQIIDPLQVAAFEDILKLSLPIRKIDMHSPEAEKVRQSTRELEEQLGGSIGDSEIFTRMFLSAGYKLKEPKKWKRKK